MESKADLILHPIRLRIIQALIGRQMITREIAKVMPDVPPATLYRHLGRLAKGGIVSAVGATRIRGAIERTYAVSLDRTAITEEDIRSFSRDDHMRLFMADGVSYSQATLYLDDDELRAFRAESAARAMRALALPPRPGRRPRVVSSIVVPGR